MARTPRYRIIDLSTASSAVFDGAGHGPVSGDSTGAELVALVPADRCSVVRVAIPEMSASRMAKALRWAVEDAIAGDPEQQHVVPVQREADGRLACLVASRTDMERWLAELPARPARMLPDAACVPWSRGEVVLMPSGDHVLARAGAATFDRLEPDLLDSFVPELLASAGDGARVCWLGDGAPAEIEPFDPVLRSGAETPLELLGAGALDPDAARFDLMRGDYGAGEEEATPRQWRLVGWLAGLVVFLVLAGALAEYAVLERERGRLQQAVEQRFERLFPEIETVVRPRAQAERALASLRGTSADRFVRLLGGVSPLFGGAEGLRVESIVYAEGRLDVELRTASLSDLEALQRQIRAQGLSAALRDVAVEDDGTRGRIEIAGPGA